MFLMKPKFTIYKSSFYIYTICQIYTVNIAKELHASGGAILAHIWAKKCFSPFCSYWFIRNIPSTNILEQIWDIWQRN